MSHLCNSTVAGPTARRDNVLASKCKYPLLNVPPTYLFLTSFCKPRFTDPWCKSRTQKKSSLRKGFLHLKHLWSLCILEILENLWTMVGLSLFSHILGTGSDSLRENRPKAAIGKDWPKRAPKSVQNRSFCATSAKSEVLHTFRRSFWNWRKPHFLRR